MARSINGLTRSIKRNSGSYWRPSPSRVMSALNRRVRSTGSTIECSRRIADTLRSSTPILSGALEQRNDAGATHEVAEPMPHEDRADLAQAWQLAGHAEQPGDHGL